MNEAARARTLLPEEVEVRIDSYSDKSFTVVCYVNPRTTMWFLDDMYGQKNWSKKITVDKKSPDTPFFATCTISVLNPDGTVTVRADVGQDDNSPKNAASDALKRAAMNFIPSLRALYTIPTLRIKSSDLNLGVTGKEKIRDAVRFMKFKVTGIQFADGATGEFVKYIQIADEETGKPVYEWQSKRKAVGREASENLLALKSKMAEVSVTEEEILKRFGDGFGVSSLAEIADTDNLYRSAGKWLEGKKKKVSKKAGTVNDQLKGKTGKE